MTLEEALAFSLLAAGPSVSCKPPQADLTEAKAKQLAGELVEVEAVERLWTSKLKTFRARLLSIGDRLRSLPIWEAKR